MNYVKAYMAQWQTHNIYQEMTICDMRQVLRLQTIMVIVNSLSQEFARFEFWWASKSASLGLVLS